MASVTWSSVPSKSTSDLLEMEWNCSSYPWKCALKLPYLLKTSCEVPGSPFRSRFRFGLVRNGQSYCLSSTSLAHSSTKVTWVTFLLHVHVGWEGAAGKKAGWGVEYLTYHLLYNSVFRTVNVKHSNIALAVALFAMMEMFFAVQHSGH